MKSTVYNEYGKDSHSSAETRPQRTHIDETYCEGASNEITTVTLASTNTDIVHYSFERALNALSNAVLRTTLE